MQDKGLDPSVCFKQSTNSKANGTFALCSTGLSTRSILISREYIPIYTMGWVFVACYERNSVNERA